MNRDSIDERYKWDLNLIYESIDKFNSDYDEVKKEINSFSKYEKTMKNSAMDFYNAIDNYYNIARKLENLAVYTSLLFDTDTSDNKNQELKGRVGNLYDEFNKISYFVTPTVLSYEYSDIENFYKEVP